MGLRHTDTLNANGRHGLTSVNNYCPCVMKDPFAREWLLKESSQATFRHKKVTKIAIQRFSRELTCPPPFL